ncbi:hypothetical protein HRD49_11365 [Corallococcus exiguus]|nr:MULTISPECIES: DUF6310 domain-containing protein [Corallococcus]NNC18698.1 hypothetical protein [Corallococcus exiguus]NRD62345.1 hypothetical protein [Corallococcus exiguus]RKH21475.1 hypothetical protein D7V77_29305 [Corallococcus sp. CA041A]
MHCHAGIMLGVLLSACATTPPTVAGARGPGLSNLQRAAKLPWTDEGQCVVREAARPWPTVVERCFQQLDQDRLRFRDTTGRCTVASADAAALGIGVCVLAAPEIAVGAVLIIGAVVVAAAIQEALDAYEFRQLYPEETRAVPETQVAIQSSLPKRKPQPQPSSGWDALVDGKNFDGLQGATRMLWEVKTNDIETYSPFVRQAELQKQVDEAKRERALAEACGFQFSIGVRTEAHKKLLEALLPDFNIVLMTWC